MSRNQSGGTELIPMPHPTGAAQLSLPIILYSAMVALLYQSRAQHRLVTIHTYQTPWTDSEAKLEDRNKLDKLSVCPTTYH